MQFQLGRAVLFGVALAAACSSNPGPVEPGIGGTGAAAGGTDRPTIESDGGLGAGYDARARIDGNANADAPVKQDAARDASGVTDAVVEAGAGDPELCSLLTQNCPKSQARSQGCYPFGSGGSACAIEGDVVPGVLCTDHSDCIAGAICSGTLNDLPVCVTVCERGFMCGGVNGCIPIQGYSAIGYCRP